MDERQLSTLLTQLVGVANAQRQLLEVLYTREMMSQSDPLASCDELAAYMRTLNPSPEAQPTPTMQQAVAHQVKAEIERHFATIRQQLASALDRRLS